MATCSNVGTTNAPPHSGHFRCLPASFSGALNCMPHPAFCHDVHMSSPKINHTCGSLRILLAHAELKSVSTSDLVVNDDGSVDIYYGPKCPPGKEKNWIPAVPGRAWFTYFRFYSPTEPYFDRSWVLPAFRRPVGNRRMRQQQTL